MRYAAVVIVLLVLAVVYFIIRNGKVNASNSQKGTTSNVISMDKHRKAKQNPEEQPCSSCKKKNGKLIFYAQDNGTVVGLCKDCQVKAKKQELLPL